MSETEEADMELVRIRVAYLLVRKGYRAWSEEEGPPILYTRADSPKKVAMETRAFVIPGKLSDVVVRALLGHFGMCKEDSYTLPERKDGILEWKQGRVIK